MATQLKHYDSLQQLAFNKIWYNLLWPIHYCNNSFHLHVPSLPYYLGLLTDFSQCHSVLGRKVTAQLTDYGVLGLTTHQTQKAILYGGFSRPQITKLWRKIAEKLFLKSKFNQIWTGETHLLQIINAADIMWKKIKIVYR